MFFIRWAVLAFVLCNARQNLVAISITPEYYSYICILKQFFPSKSMVYLISLFNRQKGNFGFSSFSKKKVIHTLFLGPHKAAAATNYRN